MKTTNKQAHSENKTNHNTTHKTFVQTFIAMFLILATMPFASADLITVGSALDATLLYYQPVPAQPGDVLDVYIQIENDGGSPSKAGTVTFIDNGPFTLESTNTRTKEFPSIPGQENFLINTKIRVSKDANEGENTLKVRVQENGATNYIERSLTISITGTSSSLSIVKATTEPTEVLPGEHTIMTIEVQNVGTTEVRNVDVSLDLDDVSFAPSGSSNSKTISSLKGGATRTFTFDLVSFPDAAPKAYQIPVTLSYDDETGNEKSQEETIGIVVGTVPELLVYFDSIELTQQQKEGDVVIRFVNKGLAEIKLLELEVLPSDEFSVTSESSRVYVGNIDEDDYESAQLTLKANKNEVSVPLKVTYRDALNQPYTQEFTLPLSLKSTSKKSGSSTGMIVVLVLVALAAFWFWRKRRNKKARK